MSCSLTPLGFYDAFNVKADTTIIISVGAAGDIAYSDRDFGAADDVFVLNTPENLSSKFLYYALMNQQNKLYQQVRRASIPRLSRESVERIKIPIPDLSEQQRIVAILDKFDTLVNSLTEGLPKEIELRQKQYEYYRGLLLDFPKPPRQSKKTKYD
ncbi:restriction endonuclease subunit S [Lonepinella koalarum]